MDCEFRYNDKIIKYQLIYKDVKNINIRVKPSGEVIVSCNKNVDIKTIELQLIKRARWLFASIERFKLNKIDFNDSKLKFVDGESFLLFGKILRIKNITSQEFKIDFDNNYLYIYRQLNKGIKEKFNKWYKDFVLSAFNKQLTSIYESYSKYNIEKPIVIYKNMKTQWGSCNVDKKIITLNLQLAKVDAYLTEYVIHHELTHLIYKNHDHNFYSFLTSMVPDWKQREKILNNIFINYIGGK